MRRIALAVLVLLLTGRAQARAADPPQTYVVPVCATATGPHPLSGWTQAQSASGFDRCQTGGGFGGVGGMTDWVTWSYRSPEDTEIVALRIWRAGAATESTRYSLSAIESDRYLATLEDTTQLGLGPVTGEEFQGLQARELTFSFECPGDPCSSADAWVRFTRMEMVVRDRVDPRVTAAGGPALASSPVTGMSSVSASFADVGGGVRAIVLLVDGAVFSVAPPECREPYASAVPCPLSGTQNFQIDSRALADGKHNVSFEVTDVAGNRSVSKPYEIDVHNAPDPSAVPVSAPRAVRLVYEWPRLDVAYGKAFVVRARVRDLAGTPVGGLKIGVSTRLAVRGAAFVPGTPVFSDTRGRVSVRLSRGPSRVVKFTYGDQAASVSVVVPAPVRFAASPAITRNGRTIRLHGSVPGTQATAAVDLQVRSGRKWITFEAVSLRNGRFSTQYRFERTFRTTRYRFRAVVRANSRFPYAAATSRVVSVLVRP